MSFDVAAEAYSRFMGRFSEPLAVAFADVADLRPGQRALDVGCGPGALTAALAAVVGVDSVAAVDPSELFVDALRDRFPGIDARVGPAEQLPYADGSFDACLAQLVVQFMSDPVRGVSEMRRVTRPGGVVAACVWDHGGDGGPLSVFWRAAQSLDPAVRGEADQVGATEGQLAGLFEQVGLQDVEAGTVTSRVAFTTFDEWWDPFTFGAGTAGDHVAALAPEAREELRSRCEELLPAAPFVVDAVAWSARGRV